MTSASLNAFNSRSDSAPGMPAMCRHLHVARRMLVWGGLPHWLSQSWSVDLRILRGLDRAGQFGHAGIDAALARTMSLISIACVVDDPGGTQTSELSCALRPPSASWRTRWRSPT